MASSASIRIKDGKKFQLTSHEVKIVAKFGKEVNFPTASSADVRRFLDKRRQDVPVDSPPRDPEQRPTLGHLLSRATHASALVVFGAGTT